MSRAALVVSLAWLLLATGLPAWAGPNGQGQGNGRIQPFVELQVSDGSISGFSATPSSSDRGPRAWSTVDALRFNGRWTNTNHIVMIDVPSATNGAAASTVTVQNTSHTIADWVHLLQDDGATFGTPQATGMFDAGGAGYSVPGGFTLSSQGSLVLRTYGDTSPADGGMATTFYWIYDANQNLYWFDDEKDFTDDDGEAKVYPVTEDQKRQYVFPHRDLTYAASAVGSAGGGYVPTVNLAWSKAPGSAGGEDFDLYALLDFPSGTPPDSYDYTVRATIHSLK